MATRMKQRRGTHDQWISTNAGQGPILEAGEIGFESDSGKFKIGDGINHWTTLPYFLDENDLGGSLGDYLQITDLGVAGKAASLDLSGKLELDQLPASVATDSEVATAVSNAVSALVDGAPAALNTLHELAAAINDDAAIASTLTSAIGEKVAKSGDTMTGTLVLSSDPTSNLHAATKAYVDTTIGTAQSNAEDYADGLAVNYDTNGLADAAETAANLYTDGVISTEVTNRNSAISTAKGEAISDSGIYTDGEITTALGTAQGYATTAEGNANLYTDGKITQEVTDRNSAISSAINAVSTSDIEEGTNKYFTDERAQDAIGNILGTGLSYNDAGPGIGINNAGLTNYLLEGASGSSYGLIGTSEYLDIKDTNGYNKEIELDITAVETKLNSDGYITTSSTSTLTNKTLNSPKINEDVVLTATATELNTLNGITTSTTELNYVDGVTSAIQGQLDDKSPIASPTFTGNAVVDNLEIGGALTFSGTATQIDQTNLTISDPLIYLADGNTDNINDLGFVANYNDGTYQHTGLARDASAGQWKLFTGVTDEPTNTVNFAQGSLDALAVGALEATSATIGDVSNTELQYLNGVTSAIQTQIDSKSPINSPTFTGTVVGITKSMVGLANVDNTTDANKPVSTVTQAALDLKAPLDSPTFTGTVAGITKSMVGLDNVDNTTDANKPVSTATQTALDFKAPSASPTFTGTVVLPLTTDGYVTTTSGGTVSSVATIPNVGLTNSKVTVGTTDISLGASSTTLAGLTSVVSTSFTGALTGNASTVTNGVYTTDTAKVTNTMLAGSIANSKLSNSTISVNGTSVSLGGSISGLATLSSPALTGTPTAPTQAAGNNSTRIATTAYADASAASAAAAIVIPAPTINAMFMIGGV